MKTSNDQPIPVRVQPVVGLRGWTFTAWKSQDPNIEEWQGVGRKDGEVKIVTHWCCYRRDAIEAAKVSAREQSNKKAE